MKFDDIDTFLHVFAESDYIEIRQFSVLHKIVLKICQNSLSFRLATFTINIDDVNVNDRINLF